MATGNGVLYAGTDAGLYKTSDNGGTWTLTAYTVPANNLLVKGDVILVNRSEFGTQRTFRSINAGASFDTVAGGLPVNFTAFDYVQMGSRMIALGSALGVGGVFSSTDDGLTWTNISGQLTFAYCGAVSGDTLYVRGSIVATTVLRRTTDFGQTWTAVPTTGLPSPIFEDLVVHNGFLFGVGNQTSVWRMPLSGTVGVEEGKLPLPNSFYLDQNYPNPFNPTTTIVYGVAHTELVGLKVFDILGRTVATLVNEVKSPGAYEIQWDAGGMASGVYLLRFTAGNLSQTRKMLLVR
jgi:hypothetical protein